MSLCRAASAVEIETVLRKVVGPIVEQVRTESAIVFLKARGYSVEEPREWETPSAFCGRIGIPLTTLHRHIDHPNCPYVMVEYGPGGRVVVRLASNRDFETFCVRGKK